MASLAVKDQDYYLGGQAVAGIWSRGNTWHESDVALLSGHICFAVSLWQFASKQHPKFPKHGFFQGWIMATSFILIGWQFLFLPTIVQYGFYVHPPQTFRMIYPTMSFVEIGMLFWMWVSSEANQSKAFFLLVMATIFFAAGESYFHGTSRSLAVPNNFNLMLWLFAYVNIMVRWLCTQR